MARRMLSGEDLLQEAKAAIAAGRTAQDFLRDVDVPLDELRKAYGSCLRQLHALVVLEQDASAPRVVPPHLRAQVLTFSLGTLGRVPPSSRREVLKFIVVPHVFDLHEAEKCIWGDTEAKLVHSVSQEDCNTAEDICAARWRMCR